MSLGRKRPRRSEIIELTKMGSEDFPSSGRTVCSRKPATMKRPLSVELQLNRDTELFFGLTAMDDFKPTA
jgi:hypothetical protein